jgi:hypothetical protein
MTLVPMRYAAAVTQTINLSCKGTTTWSSGMKRPADEGITVNLTDGTVSGAGGWSGWAGVLRITSANDSIIKFGGKGPIPPNPGIPTQRGTLTISGSIDRVTGHALVYSVTFFEQMKQTVTATDDMTCNKSS